MEYTIIELKVPVGSEEQVKSLASVAVERFLMSQMAGIPVEQKPEYQEAVDTFRKDNKMALKFTKEEEIEDIEVKPL
jgi:hypothetical protein